MKNFLYVAAIGAAVSVTACQEVRLESNLDPQNFVEYAKPSTVEEYTDESILDHRFHSLGMIAGLACQEKETDFIARESEARLDAKIQTADLGGNGIVFGKCIRLEKTKACHVSVTCYAEGFIIDDNFNRTKEEPVVEQAPQQEEAKVVAEEVKAAPVVEEVEPMSRQEIAEMSEEDRLDRAARIALKAEAESQATQKGE